MSKKDLNENMYYADLQPVNKIEATNLEGWESSFKNYLAEAKKEDDEAVKVDEKKVSKHVEEVNSHNYDYQDYKNLDNQIGEEVRKGIYFEAKQNPNKSLDEVKSIVAKNLDKDSLYYVKEGVFGVEGLGYTEQKQEEVSGKHKASGYSDKLKTLVKESLMGGQVVTTGNPMSYASQQAAVINQMMNEQDEMDEEMSMDELDITMKSDEGVALEPVAEDEFAENARTDAEEEGYLDGMHDEKMDLEKSKMEAELEEEKEKEVKKDKSGKAKKESLQNVMSRIERVGSGVALEAKIGAIDEEINARNEQLAMLDENEAMAQLMDKGKIKELRKEMKLLEKQKAKYDKMYEKATGKKRAEIVDETEI